MSNEQISDLRVTLARLEERQIQLFSMVETSLANYADVANRLSALEHLRTKVLAVAGLIGLACSMAWDVLKNRFSN
jgi:flagellar biosynthesis chaperone FliJ